MNRRYMLEICVESVEAAMVAERGGADRIELCSDLHLGGLTPSPELMMGTRANVAIPIFAMIRPRVGNFMYSDQEFATMRTSMRLATEMQMDGFALGLLRANGRVDIERTKELIEVASPASVTFHRAFDECADLRGALEDVIETGAKRLLTSGGERTAGEALGMLGELVKKAGERLIVVPGSGLHAGNIRKAVQKTSAREYHAGLSSVVAQAAENLETFEEEVRKMAVALADCG
jgi:copper homeostasis protein